MSKLVLNPTSTAQWHSLVCEAEAAVQFYLDEELQSYLVFLLMRFLDKPEIAATIVAIEYIEGLLTSGNCQHDKLRNVGDICLLHAGFFPKRAKRRRVSERYYVELGCGAYQQLSDMSFNGVGVLYERLSKSFVPLMDILQAMRNVGDQNIMLQSLHAFDQWMENESAQSLRGLERIALNFNTLQPSPVKH